MYGIFNGTFKYSIFNNLIKSIGYCLDVIDAAPPNTKVSPKTSVNAGFFMPEDTRGDKTSKESEGKVKYDVLVRVVAEG